MADDEKADRPAGDTGLSHDPKTWLRPGGAGSAGDPELSGGGTSFNPRAWVAEAPKPEPKAKPSVGGSKAGLAAGAAILGVLVIAGGAFALLHKPKAKAPATAAAFAPAADTVSDRALSIAGVAALGPALRAAGVAPDQAAGAQQAAAAALGDAAGELRLQMRLIAAGSGPSRLYGLELMRADGSGVRLTTADGGAFKTQVLAADTKLATRTVHGEMDADSFYTSAVAAGVTDALIPEFAQAFAFDFDFQREIHRGDVFEAVWQEQVNAQGQPVGQKRLLYVSMTTPAKSRALYRFTPPGEAKEGWYDGAGRSAVKSLMRTPVQVARISSTFGWRIHPILGFEKLHKGVDFAAPVGTPIFAAGDGVVEWAAPKGPDGNLVILKHDNGWKTYYLHMSAFGPGIAAGARVQQGQTIGAVGATGQATGPHLHYELHVSDEAVDPASVAAEEGKPLAGDALKAFKAARDQVDAARAGQV